LKIDLEANKWY
jgi:hypothetical protein